MNTYDIEELILGDEDLLAVRDGTPSRLSAGAEEKIQTLKIRRLVVQSSRVVDLSGIEIVLIPEQDEPTEIICTGRVIASRLHADHIQLGGLLVDGPGLISTDPEGWLAVSTDLICDKLFGSQIVVGGVLSAEVLTAENIAADRLYVGTLLDGIHSLVLPTKRYFDGECWTRGAYVGHAVDPAFSRLNGKSPVEFKKLLGAAPVPDFADADALERYRLRDRNELTIVGMAKIRDLRAKLQSELRRSFGGREIIHDQEPEPKKNRTQRRKVAKKRQETGILAAKMSETSLP